MRLKVESVAPLPHVKAWFSTNAVPTILDLKASLCSDLSPLSHDRVRPQDVLLLLDDFELLDSSAIDVVRDGDLVVIKKKPVPPVSKRKATSQDIASPARKRTKTEDGRTSSRAPVVTARAPPKLHAKPRPEDPSSDSSTDSESEDNSTDSDSDSESESSSDSDSNSSESSSSSSSSSATSSAAGRPHKNVANAPAVKQLKANPAKPDGPPVPPGLGKPATHSRNLRRRRKRMYERLTATAEPASVNDIPLGTRAHTVDDVADVAEVPPEPRAQPPLQVQPARVNGKGKAKATELPLGETPAFMMASLQNKNKRRGFKNALTQGVPPKIVFPDADNSENPVMDVDQDAQIVEAALQPQPSPPEAETPRLAQPRLIPPSEKQERGLIPANMFVTSVDVEEGLWPAKGKKKKKKKVQAEKTWDYEEEDTFAGGLPYDDVPEVPAPANTTPQGDITVVGSAEHAVVAAKWDSLRKITDRAQVPSGTTVAWKALGINFTTLTPEMLLHIGRVTTCDDFLVVERLAESGSAEVSFGGAIAEEEGGAVEETFEWPDVLSGDWRLVATR
ncbi:hypothetical protein C8Q79DRAFT_1022626 [Trametes meyenii]|nr:hypothetical protein C8Q79DRAFT_1022626 [Trametes meyenii]